MSNRERIAAVLVGEEDRIMCLPRLFGLARMIEVEAVTYGYMSKLSADYTGAYWHFYTLSNGGFYMAPGDQPQYRLEWDGNGFSGDVSADAAGLIAPLFMLGHMHEKYGEDQFAQLYAWASAYAAQHSEAGPIGAALD